MITRISIAEISLAVDSSIAGREADFSGLLAGTEYEKFVASGPDNISIVLRPDKISSFQGNKYRSKFDSSALWVLHHNNRSDFRIEYKKGFQGVTLSYIDVDLNTMDGTIFVTEDGLKAPETEFLPFVHPLDGVIFINLLPSYNGVLLHACGIDDNGRGFVFPGRSGDGKSTTARLWEGEAGVKVLSDERIIIREIGGELYAFGTPWHGEVEACGPGKVEIEMIFFLEHAEKNYAKHISSSDAAERMFVRCLPTFWDKDGMELTLSLINRIVEKIPCYELGFGPDKSAVDFVRRNVK